MGSSYSTLSIFGIIFLVVGIIALIAGLILLVVNRSSTVPQPWYVWALIGIGLVLGIIGVIMIAIAYQSPVVVVPPAANVMVTDAPF